MDWAICFDLNARCQGALPSSRFGVPSIGRTASWSSDTTARTIYIASRERIHQKHNHQARYLSTALPSSYQEVESDVLLAQVPRIFRRVNSCQTPRREQISPLRYVEEGAVFTLELVNNLQCQSSQLRSRPQKTTAWVQSLLIYRT